MGRHEDPRRRTVPYRSRDDTVHERLREVRPFHLDHEVFLEGRRDDPDEAISASGPCGFLAQDDLFNERQFAEPLEALVDKAGFWSRHVRNNTHSISNRQLSKPAGRAIRGSSVRGATML